MEAFAHKADAEAFCKARSKEGPAVRYRVEEIHINFYIHDVFEKKKTAAEAAAS